MNHSQLDISALTEEIRAREEDIKNLRDQALKAKLDVVFNLAALVYGVTRQDLIDRRRVGLLATEARQIAMYLANVTLSIPYPEIGAYVNRNRGTIRYSIERVEDRRDNEAFDTLIASLETLLSGLMKEAVADVISKGVVVDFDIGDELDDDSDIYWREKET